MSTQEQLANILQASKAAREAEKAQREAAKVQKDAEKAKRAEENAAKKAAREAKKAEREARKQEQQPEANGIRRPRPDTLCGQAWAVMDDVTLSKGELCTIKEVIDEALVRNPDVNLNNLRGEFVRWKRYNGVI